MPDLARPAGERSAPAAQHPRHLGGEGVEELRRLLWRGTRELRPADIAYRAAPLKGTGTVAGQSVVHLDLPRLAVPARALREDRAGLPR
ncbi:LytR family transcriptional regulator [Streptomyces albidoflavus]|uniref:LytR family transcriptional regulator n=1 Tax=Streptomyces albidoflavus TaxID=1886 RepID=UPI0033A4E38F